MIFRVHPESREAELGTYCIGGPAHSPHVVAQVASRRGNVSSWACTLAEGAYRLRGPQLPHALDFAVSPTGTTSQWELSLARIQPEQRPRSLRVGGQRLILTNDHFEELVVRVERTASRQDALTAARASASALFRELFPGEVLSPGQLVSVATVTLLRTDLDLAGSIYESLGDTQAFAVIHEHYRLLEEQIRKGGGALVKTVGEGMLAVFQEARAAVQTALELSPALAAKETTRDLRLCIAVHRGPAMAATLNAHLDYFGITVTQTAELIALARGGDLIVSESIASDPSVAELLSGRGLQGEVVRVDLSGRAGAVVQRVHSASGFVDATSLVKQTRHSETV